MCDFFLFFIDNNMIESYPSNQNSQKDPMHENIEWN